MTRGSQNEDRGPRARRITMTLLVLLSLCGCGDDTDPLVMSGTPSYETTLLLQAPVLNEDGIDRVVYRWSTKATHQTITMDDLDDLVVELYAGASLVYTDQVRMEGSYRPMDGVDRSELTWNFDFGAGVLTQMSNVLLEQLTQTTGSQYSVEDNRTLQVDGEVWVRRATDGELDYIAKETLASQTTVLVH